MAQTTLRLEYSAFFSSGLLAQHTPQKKVNSSSSWNATLDHSPSRPSSPISIPDESLMDIDMASYNDRSITPTPGTKTPVQSPQPVKIQATSQAQPKLRKRRSSLTLATSPMNTIRSPSRAANNALHLQCQLYTAIGPVSPRSRSGSLSGEDATASRCNAGVASSETSFGGRLRSGSFGCALPPGPLRRRPIRRLHISALQAPLAPPTIPLPALPPHSDHQHFRTNLNTPTRTAHTKVSSISSASTTSARARGLSVSSSALDGDEHRIDENMKEI